MISCQVEIPESAKLTFKDTPADNALTVGSPFQLLCNGQWPTDFYPPNSPLPQFVLLEDDADKLKLLNFEFTAKDQAKLLVTSYKPGLNQVKNLVLKSGELTQDLGGVEWTVASVINPQEPPAGPYGPLGPFKLSIPMLYWLLLLAVIFMFVFTIGARLYRRSQRKKLMQDPRLQESALKPAQQFFQILRKLQRESTDFSTIVSGVEEAYRIYISRVFSVPALRWNRNVIIKDIKRRKKLNSEQLLKMKKNLGEFERAAKAKSVVSEKDCAQLVELVRQHVDSLESEGKVP